MRRYSLLSLALLLLNLAGAASAPKPECDAKHLFASEGTETGGAQPDAPAPSDRAEVFHSAADDARLREIVGLRREINQEVGLFGNPFTFETSMDGQREVYARLREKFPIYRDAVELGIEAMQKGEYLDPGFENAAFRQSLNLLLEYRELKGEDAQFFDKERLVGAIETLRRLEQVRVSRLVPPRPSEDKSSEKDKDADKDKKEEKEKKDEEEDEDPEPNKRDPMDTYEAYNKDTDQSGEGESGGKEASMGWVNELDHRYFRERVFNTINGKTGAWARQEIDSPPLKRVSQPTRLKLTMRPGNRIGKIDALVLPQGFLPVLQDTADGSVKLDRTGNYTYVANVKRFVVELMHQGKASRPLSEPEKLVYTAPCQTTIATWPQHLQEQIQFALKARDEGRFEGTLGNYKLAAALSEYIRKAFLYKVDGEEKVGPPTYAAQGAFQCDTAATILVSILRDVFKIPCRAIGGYTGKQMSGDWQNSHFTSGMKHAWVEVADLDGNWWGVDPTPTEKDRKTDEASGKKNKFKDFPDPNAKPDPSEKKDKDGEKSEGEDEGEAEGEAHDGKPKPGKSGGAKDLKEILEREARAMDEKMRKLEEAHRKQAEAEAKAAAEKANGEKAKGEKGEKGEKDEKSTDASKSSPEDENRAPPVAVDQLLKQMADQNRFTVNLLKRLTGRALDLHLSTAQKRERLEQIKTYLMDDQFNEHGAFPLMRQVLADATRLFQEERPSIPKWFDRINEKKSEVPVNATVDEICLIERQLEFTLRFAEEESRPGIEAFLERIRAFKSALRAIKHKNSESIRIAEEMWQKLPGKISRGLLREKYGIKESLGDDIATGDLADAITGGGKHKGKRQHDDERLMAINGPDTEFMVKPLSRKSRGFMKTQESGADRGNWEVMMTDSWKDRPRFVRFDDDPRMSDEEVMARGEMYALDRRRRVKTSKGHKDTDPEKVTIIYYDVSGSMNGEPAEFQSNFIGALVDRALSDQTPGGKCRHRVYVIPFGDTVGEKIEVTTVQEARDLLKDVKNKTGNKGSGTNIQVAILDGLRLMKEANQTGQKALARGTLIIATDGQADISPAAVREAAKAVNASVPADRRTEILLGAVAINTTSPELQAITLRKDIGMDRALYREFNAEDIARRMGEAKSAPKAVNDFWTAKTWAEVPAEIKREFEVLARAVPVFEASGDRARQSREISLRPFTDRGAAALGSSYDQREQRRKASDGILLFKYRELLGKIGPRLPEGDRTWIMEDTLRFWFGPGGVAIDQLDREEMGHLDHMMDWPVTGEPNSRKPTKSKVAHVGGSTSAASP